MKTIEEFYREFIDSKELQEELHAASDEMLEAFLRKHECDADVETFTALMCSQNEGEIDDDDAKSASGGSPPYSAKPKTGQQELL